MEGYSETMRYGVHLERNGFKSLGGGALLACR